MQPIKTNPKKAHTVRLSGGLNQVATSLEMPDGNCVQLLNYEINQLGDYQSVTGFERFDGQAAPSSAIPPNGPYVDDAVELADVLVERERLRALIQPVPGSGKVLGGFMLLGIKYAFRNTADGANCALYRATNSGWQLVVTPSLLPDGSYKFRALRWVSRGRVPEIIGVDGKNKAFVFDGTAFTQITNAGMGANDTPISVEILPSELVLMGYPNGSLQYTPKLDWAAPAGQGELATASDILEIDAQPNDVTAIFCRNRTYLLYGRGDQDPNWRLTDLSKDTGIVPNTVQTIGDSVYVDDRGITRLSRVQEFGNFDMSSFSQLVDPLLGKYRKRIVASTVVREKNQYRLFFDDGTGLIASFSGANLLGFSQFDFYKNVSCTWNAEDNTGAEQVFFGDDKGYVYQMERGTSFDGNAIVTVMRPAFTPCKLNAIRKKFVKLEIEAKVVSETKLLVVPDFDHSAPTIAEHSNLNIKAIGGGGYWGQALFDDVYWSAASLFNAPLTISGRGTEISAFIRTESLHAGPHIISAVIYHFARLGWRK